MPRQEVDTMTLSYRTIKEEIEAGRYTVKRALEIIGV